MIPAWRDAFDRDAAAFADVLAASDPRLPVESCPDWTLADLTGHLGGIHRWAQAALGTPVAGPPPAPAQPVVGDLHTWFVEGADALGTALRSVDPDEPCWGFGPKPRTASFWLRRQAHETAMHRWDAETAAGLPATYDEALAADGVAELLEMFLPRQLRRGRVEEFPEVLRIVAEGTVHDIGQGAPHATVTGPSDAVLLMLWRRISPDDPRLSISGDRAALVRVLARPITP